MRPREAVVRPPIPGWVVDPRPGDPNVFGWGRVNGYSVLEIAKARRVWLGSE